MAADPDFKDPHYCHEHSFVTHTPMAGDCLCIRRCYLALTQTVVCVVDFVCVFVVYSVWMYLQMDLWIIPEFSVLSPKHRLVSVFNCSPSFLCTKCPL